MNIAIIPARGGSKRIPRKNIKDFLGRPIIAYAIRAALESGLFDEVMVSTDDDEIAQIARQYGAAVPFLRSKHTADDYATTVDVLLEVLEKYRQAGREFSTLSCIYPTALFITAQKLQKAMHIFQDCNADALIPVVPFSFPPMRGLVLNNGRLYMKWPENESVRSQDLEPIYHDSGQFYILRESAMQHEKTLFCKNTVTMILSELEVQDIDNDVDWELAEMKYRLLMGRGLL